MVDYWVYQLKGDQPYVGWMEPANPATGSANALWGLGLNGITSGHPTTALTVPDAVAELASKCSLPPPNHTIAKYPVQPGEFHSRIWRNHHDDLPRDERAFLSSEAATRLHLKTLEDIFSTIEPDMREPSVYGHRLRHFLVLTSTDIEAGWGGVLRANGYPERRWTTNDYIKLAKPMRLNEWKVRLSSYPDYQEITPFEGWDPAKVGTSGFSPTESLKWYDAYNRVKHNRELNLSLASITHVITAAAAMYVMEMAQFGRNMGGNGFFTPTSMPAWKSEELYFFPQPHGASYRHVNFPFPIS